MITFDVKISNRRPSALENRDMLEVASPVLSPTSSNNKKHIAQSRFSFALNQKQKLIDKLVVQGTKKHQKQHQKSSKIVKGSTHLKIPIA